MVIGPRPPGDMKFSDIYEAVHRGILQNNRLLMLRTPLGENTLIPIRAHGSAKIGRDYTWTVDVASLQADIKLLSLIHQPVTLLIQQPTAAYANLDYRPVHGFVRQFNYLGADGSLSVYQIEFGSAVYFLSRSHDDNFWLDRDTRDIISDVFNKYPQLQGRFRFNLTNSPRNRSYCRQSESDLDFIHRLLEDEGWYFYWEHANEQNSDNTTLVIVDRISALPQSKSVEFYRGNTGDEADGFTQWSIVQTMQSMEFVSRSSDYKRPWAAFEASSTLDPSSTTYTVEQRRERQIRNIPAVPMIVYEPTAYGYPDVDSGQTRARIRTQAWGSASQRYRAVGGVGWMDAGSRFVLDHHPRHDELDSNDREFMAIRLDWFIENNVPIGQHSATFTHSLQSELTRVQTTHGNSPNVRPQAADGSTGFFLVEVEAQRANVEYRSPFEHAKPLMKIEYAIVGAQGNEEASADAYNRVRGRFTWDHRSPAGSANTSPWLLSLHSDTGDRYGSVHVPRKGELVAIGHLGGDCDKPFILGRLNAGDAQPPWHTNVLLSGFQSRGFGDTGAYSALLHDDSTHQAATRLTTFAGDESGSYTLFHQGYLIAQDGNTRGDYLGMGFLTHTDDYGTVRAKKGLYLSTHPKSHDDEQLDVQEAREQLIGSTGVIEGLSSISDQHNAESLKDGHDALTSFTDSTQSSFTPEAKGGRTAGGGTGDANAFKKALMLLASPFGIGMSTQDSMHITADRHINLVSGLNTYIASARSLVANAAGVISMFSQATIKVFAKGPIQVQSHDANIEVLAKAVLKLLAHGDVEIAAGGKLVLTAGGASITLEGGNVRTHAPGLVETKAAQHQKAGPASLHYPIPDLPKEQRPVGDQHFVLRSHGGQPVPNQRYRVTAGDKVIEGRTDANGKTELVEGDIGQPVHFELLENYDEHFILRDPLGQPIANMPYQIKSASGQLISGTSDAEGKTSLLTSEKIEHLELLHAPGDEAEYPEGTGVN